MPRPLSHIAQYIAMTKNRISFAHLLLPTILVSVYQLRICKRIYARAGAPGTELRAYMRERISDEPLAKDDQTMRQTLTGLPGTVTNEEDLDELLSHPTPALTAMMQRLDGDIIILGIAGKIGISLGIMAVRAIRAAGVHKRIIGLARFYNPATRPYLLRAGRAM